MIPQQKLDVLRRAGSLLKVEGGMPQVRQAEQISQFADGGREGLRGITISQHTWGTFLRSRGMWKPQEPDFLPMTWLWFETEHSWALDKAIAQLSESGKIQSNQITKTLYNFLYPDEDYPKSSLERLDGRFVMIRPYFYDSSKFMVSTLQCNAEKAKFVCQMEFINEENEQISEIVEGSIVPYEDRFLCIGKILKKKAPFIFILSHCGIDNDIYFKASGTIMVGAPSYFPNASPISIRRTNVDYKIGIYQEHELGQLFPFWDGIKDQLNRGNVEWKNNT